MFKQKCLSEKVTSKNYKIEQLKNDKCTDGTYLYEKEIKGIKYCIKEEDAHHELHLSQDLNGEYKCFGPKIPDSFAQNPLISRQGGCHTLADNPFIYNNCYIHNFSDGFKEKCENFVNLNQKEDDLILEFWHELESKEYKDKKYDT